MVVWGYLLFSFSVFSSYDRTLWTFRNVCVDQQGTWSFCLFGALLVPRATSQLLIKLHPLRLKLYKLPPKGVLAWHLESMMLNETSFGTGRVELLVELFTSCWTSRKCQLQWNANYNEIKGMHWTLQGLKCQPRPFQNTHPFLKRTRAGLWVPSVWKQVIGSSG